MVVLKEPFLGWQSNYEISFKMTVTQTLTTVREMKIMPLLRYLHHYNLA
jgi:hypothetical protein